MHKVNLLAGTGGMFNPKSPYRVLKYFFMKDNILSQKSELTDFLSEMLRSLSQIFRMITRKKTDGT
jgi:hypothetical protein